MKDYYVIKPALKWWNSKLLEDKLKKGKSVPENFEYESSKASLLMSKIEIDSILGK